MDVKQLLDLIVDGNIVSISYKDDDNVIFKGVKGTDSFEEYYDCKVYELYSGGVQTEAGDYVYEMDFKIVN
ncbi:hypothetical protein VNN41_06325 [Lactococcus garvieae]|uniref:hypothetical protein n=1 Tax=Lactococcus garvieae TaxID=1363 RepID=UPI0032439B7F